MGKLTVVSNLSSKKFNINLQNNKHYTLELTKIGYYTKRIIVETNTSKTSEPYEFKIELVKISDNEINEKEFDFPVAIIKYNEKKGFYFKSIKKL
ncbi:MAG: hypothetical protein RQ875_05390 [Vicingaceae bacterium]|nr:hypothetical protein [Vicingaceae bacterium]